MIWSSGHGKRSELLGPIGICGQVYGKGGVRNNSIHLELQSTFEMSFLCLVGNQEPPMDVGQIDTSWTTTSGLFPLVQPKGGNDPTPNDGVRLRKTSLVCVGTNDWNVQVRAFAKGDSGELTFKIGGELC